MRAVLDPNVIISAALSPAGAPAQVVQAWLDGRFELVASPLLLEELERALRYPKLRERVSEEEAGELLELLLRGGAMADDPKGPPPVRSPDPDDDYIIALAAAAEAVIVSGDSHLLGLSGDLPVYGARTFLALLEEGGH
ncbi:MAG: putative toxin-antitoxin system toxin component, PIN family [Acidimicrobiales bacterium]